MFKLRRSALAVLAVALAVVGCTGTTQPTTQTNATPPAAKSAPPAASGDVELRVVKLPQWNEALASLKGKVVVIDVWATYCSPCMKKFPQFVELHEKYSRDGLACVSLTVDSTDDHGKALEFLKKRKATFANYLIDETTEEWQDKLGIGNPPQALVFDRDGKRVQKFPNDAGNEYTFEDVEKAFLPLLKK